MPSGCSTIRLRSGSWRTSQRQNAAGPLVDHFENLLQSQNFLPNAQSSSQSNTKGNDCKFKNCNGCKRHGNDRDHQKEVSELQTHLEAASIESCQRTKALLDEMITLRKEIDKLWQSMLNETASEQFHEVREVRMSTSHCTCPSTRRRNGSVELRSVWIVADGR